MDWLGFSGIRAALERGAGRRPAPVLATLAGSAAAVLAVVTAVVFGASLNGLVTHPALYGWNWTLLMDTQGGYGSWPVSQMDKLVNGQPGVTGWSTFGFTQVPIDGQNVPALGLTRHVGSVQPPTTSGHPISGPLQIELGAAIVNAAQMGDQPLALALALAAAALLSLAVALLASVRHRRPELALLKTLGLTRRQVRAVVAWQASAILLVAALVGVPLGIVAGRWAWAASPRPSASSR